MTKNQEVERKSIWFFVKTDTNALDVLSKYYILLFIFSFISFFIFHRIIITIVFLTIIVIMNRFRNTNKRTRNCPSWTYCMFDWKRGISSICKISKMAKISQWLFRWYQYKQIEISRIHKKSAKSKACDQWCRPRRWNRLQTRSSVSQIITTLKYSKC